MKRKLINVSTDEYPEIFHRLIKDARVYDSSCSPSARVVFIDKDGGYYLKSAEKGMLKREAELTRYFNKKGFATRVYDYMSDDRDWLLTAKVDGEDCTYKSYLDFPERLCETLAEILYDLHHTDFAGCPVENRIESYLRTAEHNYRKGLYDPSLFPDNWGYKSAEQAWSVVENAGHLLKNDCLIHGDFCLPNIMLYDWKLSGLIDLGNGGVGDRHIDLFWGAWSLFFNLKTDKYTDRFFDAYGRLRIDKEVLKVVAAAEVFG